MDRGHERGARTGPRRRLHGRRWGRPLRKGQQQLMETLLPRLEIRLPEAGERLDPRALFDPPPRAVWLEIGFGAGEHIAWQAARHPEIGLIGAEVFRNGVAKLLRRVEERGLGNVRVLVGDGRDLVEVLPDASLERLFVLFPDPWPKTRHHKRRLVQDSTLDAFARVLADSGELRLATDDMGYLRWTLAHLRGHPAFEWLARRPRDWRERPADWPATRYELKALGQGRRPAYLRYRRRARAAEPGDKSLAGAGADY